MSKTEAAHRHDMLIVGGGMVGLTLAATAAHHGLDVCVVDREDAAAMVDTPFDGRASAIAHASCQLLAASDIWAAIAPAAQPILDIRVSDGDSRLFLHYDHRDLGDTPFGYMIENREIRRALFAVAARQPLLSLRSGTTVEALERGAGTVSARLSDGGTVRAALAIGADGRFSPTRDAAGIRTAGWTYPQAGIVCTVAHERDHRGIAHERFLPPGPFAILPLTGRRASLVWTEHGDLAPAIMALDDAQFAAEMRRRFGDFLGATEIAGPRWSYPLALHHADRYVDHRLALIGDAAHGLHPIAGQGLNLGFRDIAALVEVVLDAQRLGLDIGARDVLERYQRWRRADNVLLLAVTDGLNRLFSNDIDPVRLARDLGLAAVDRLPGLKRKFMEHARGTVGKLPRLLEGIPL
ncbi:MAG: UbiH/UbiF/VisC/COQ6 family ubiquinone biosynthesis hydroxylase [Proteobacteria bacterium]|nr:UbiH/UbiF/VisC/COQ6 family ubiquinone biosynthesis hydroxylase [Pseudomonadota bacterium]